MIPESFKFNTRSKKIKTISLTLEDFQKLFEIVREWNEEAKKLQTQSIYENWERNKELYKEEDVVSTNEKFLEKYVVGVEILTEDGEYFRSFNPDEAFDKKKFPDNVILVRIANSFLFDAQNALIQSYRILTEIDFRRPIIMDLTSNNSFETSNNSFVEVLGINIGWTEGAFKKLEYFLNQRSNKRTWLHRKNVYGLFIWLCFAPIVLWNINKIEKWIYIKIPNISNVLLVIIYLYVFFIALLTFAIIFRFLRNLFPPIEIVENPTNKKITRRIVTSVLSFIVIEQIGELLIGLLKLLF
jgi:hypothetical protein